MTSADELVAEVQAFAGLMTGLLDTANARADTAETEVTALQTQVSALQAQLAAVAPVHTAVVGSSLWPNVGETYAQAYLRTRAALGIKSVRIYSSERSGGLRHAVDQVVQLRAAGHKGRCYLSFVQDVATTNSGALDNYYLTQLARLSDLDYVAGWHECDRHSMVLREYAAADVVAAQQRLWNLNRRAFGAAHLGHIVTGNHLDVWWPLFDVGDAYREWVGIDPYAPKGVSAHDYVRPILDFLRARTAQPLAICEIGGWYSPQDPAYVASLGALVVDPDVSALHWFEAVDSSHGLDFRISGSAACAAALEAVAAAGAAA